MMGSFVDVPRSGREETPAPENCKGAGAFTTCWKYLLMVN